ncbi:hypothetical protein DICPUDRAFT_78375 [Dictyostelium purpureum]|uniref:FNIP repeat-containing protein n=1 Tax=Dictyostelium purpureum TaxID=5786 RepID=F0ZJD0_DICPU|nr:uncharacterized protein DICPUDRAFT_78375 [Dictyostelium purpureum]EGC35958.1 hypothetical protein DICPUDRAFT_78375 [Dictyostelium purpureum]|eukprot:XP_003287531.1 hypothetical protein DICPUDRAFT_78375 [Dictyostelium purpureum]
MEKPNLFIIIWSNIYLKSLIIKHLRLYYIFRYKYFNRLEDFIIFKYKEYLSEIIFSFSIDKDIDLETILPSNIECIKLHNYYNFNSKVPSFIKSFGRINIGEDFSNENIKNSNLQKIFIGKISGNKKLNFKELLPNSITSLNIEKYQLSLENELPPNLKILKCQYKAVNKNRAIPQSVTKLKYLMDRDSTLTPKTLPDNLLFLKLEKNFLGHVHLPMENGFVFPQSLTYLEMYCGASLDFRLPSQLKHLDLEMLESAFPITTEMLPKTLKTFIFYGGSNFDHDKVVLPDTIEKLEFSLHWSGNSFNQQLKKQFLPNSLKQLSFKNHHPSRLQIEKGFNNGGFPLIEEGLFKHTQLTSIDFGDIFNQPIGINVLPPTLKKLKFGKCFNQELIEGSLPYSLEFLNISNLSYNKFIKPSNPYTIVFSKSYYNQFENSPEKLLTMKMLPLEFYIYNEKPSINKYKNLEVLDLSYSKDFIQFSKEDLPSNSIKKLILNFFFVGEIDLKYFQNLETIAIKGSNPKITTSIDENGFYNYYNLKTIKVKSKDYDFLESAYPLFNQFFSNKK